MHSLFTALIVCVLTVVQDGTQSFSIETLDGSTTEGAIAEWGEKGIKLARNGKSIEYSDLLMVKPTKVEVVDPPEIPIAVGFTDGSKLTAKSYEVKGRTATIEVPGGRKLEIPTRVIQYVRFRKADDAVAEQWAALMKETPSGDTVVLRRAAKSIDDLSGIVRDVTAESVDFELDGNRVELKRAKLEGVIYYHASGRKLPGAVCQVETAAGELWQTREIKQTGQMLTLVTRAGVEIQLPLSSVKSFDFSAGNLVYLSDIDWEAAKWTSHLGVGLALEEKMFAPQRNRGLLFSGKGLMLGNRKYDKGLALHTKTEITYRLTDDYKRLTAIAGVDERAGEGGDLNLVIFGDDRVLFRKQIKKGDKPVPIDLEISGVRRLKILADFGENGSIADHLVLCQARITK